MEIHIGQLIKAELEATGMKKSEFARRINRTPQNVFDVFQRKSIDTTLLANISVILKYNFFEHLYMQYETLQEQSPELLEIRAKYGSTANLLKALSHSQQALEHCEARNIQLSKEVDYLTEINRLLKKK
jgi:hypothetical protein